MTISIMSPTTETSESLQRVTVAPPSDPAPKGARCDVGFDKVVAKFLERRGEAADLVFGRSQVDDQESVAKKQHGVIIESPVSPALINNTILLQEQIKEIRELVDGLVIDAPPEKNREVLYCIYTRAAEAIGRNSTEAIKADTVKRLEYLLSTSAIPSFCGRYGDTPEVYVQRELVPNLHPDMRQFAFEQNIFRESMKKFYSTIKAWRFEGRRGVEKFKVRSS